jgi:tetrapyrrole (corrin/porphyrin) methylase-like protein
MSETENRTSTSDRASQPLGAVEVPFNLVVAEVDIHVVGYGNRLPNDFTLETLAVLKSCKRVFGAPPIHAPQFGIPAMEDLVELCDSDAADELYEEMAEVVLAAAASDPPVAFATFGSPMVGMHPAHRIVELAGQRGLTIHVSNAVPSFDAIWADLNIEPFFGFAIWDMTTFVRLAIKPTRSAHLLLLRGSMVGAADHTERAAANSSAGVPVPVLRDHLLRFYGPEHEVHLVDSKPATGPRLLAAGVKTIALRDLEPSGCPSTSALLVPRAQRARFDFDRSVAGAAVGD